MTPVGLGNLVLVVPLFRRVMVLVRWRWNRWGMTDTPTHTIVMTGASRGIGAIAAAKILEDDPNVHLVLVGRSPGAASDRTTFVQADLTSADATAAAGRAIAASLRAGELPPLDGIAGNAGIQYTDARTSTADGFEATFAVNVLANHVLVRELRECLRVPSRIVITVSDTHFGDLKHNLAMVPGPVWKSPEVLARVGAFDKPDSAAAGRTAYSTSKLAAIYQVHALSRSLPEGVEIISFNPGFVPGTELGRNAGPVSRFVMKRFLPLLARTPVATTPAQAGAALADVMSGAVPAGNGDYVDRRRVVRSSEESYDETREAELMAFLSEATPPVRA